MRKKTIVSFVLGIVTGALFFGGAIAASGVIANPTTSTVTVDGVETPVEAYNINGYNYFKLRDFCSAVDIGVWYEVREDAIHIEMDKGYDPNYDGTNYTASWEVHYTSDIYDKYTTPAVVNGLGGMLLKVTGTVGIAEVVGTSYVWVVEQPDGNSWVITQDVKDAVPASVGDYVECFGVYLGVSKRYGDMPSLMLLRAKYGGTSYSAKQSGSVLAELLENLTFEERNEIIGGASIVYYDEFPTVPDFGAYFGMMPLTYDFKGGVLTLEYTMSGISGGMYLEYEGMLINEGFFYNSFISDALNQSAQVGERTDVYEGGGVTVMIKQYPEQINKIMIIISYA